MGRRPSHHNMPAMCALQPHKLDAVPAGQTHPTLAKQTPQEHAALNFVPCSPRARSHATHPHKGREALVNARRAGRAGDAAQQAAGVARVHAGRRRPSYKAAGSEAGSQHDFGVQVREQAGSLKAENVTSNALKHLNSRWARRGTLCCKPPDASCLKG